MGKRSLGIVCALGLVAALLLASGCISASLGNM